MRQETVRSTPISQFIYPGKNFVMYNFFVLMFMLTLTGKCNSRKAINLTKIGQMTGKGIRYLDPPAATDKFRIYPMAM